MPSSLYSLPGGGKGAEGADLGGMSFYYAHNFHAPHLSATFRARTERERRATQHTLKEIFKLQQYNFHTKSVQAKLI